MKANLNRIYLFSPRCLEATKKESGWRVFRRVMTLAVAGAVLCLPANLAAQQLGVDVTSAQQESGTDLGNYHTNFDIEACYRFVGTEGNASMYSTWVNMQQGPRILSSDLSMRSLNHDGFLFDRLNMSSFGYGGDPPLCGHRRQRLDVLDVGEHAAGAAHPVVGPEHALAQP